MFDSKIGCTTSKKARKVRVPMCGKSVIHVQILFGCRTCDGWRVFVVLEAASSWGDRSFRGRVGRTESNRLLSQRHRQSCCCRPPHGAAGQTERQVRLAACNHTHAHTQTTHSHTLQSIILLSSSWTAVSGALDQQLQRSRGILQVWEVYARLAASFSQRLQALQSDAKSALSGAPTDDNTVEQVAVKVHKVQVRK